VEDIHHTPKVLSHSSCPSHLGQPEILYFVLPDTPCLADDMACRNK
jgi:hypothetical protein